MFGNTRYIIKTVPKIKTFLQLKGTKNYFPTQIPAQCYSKKKFTDIEVIDVNIDKMMYNDKEFAANFNYKPPPEIINTNELKDAITTEIDFDLCPYNGFEAEGIFANGFKFNSSGK